MAVRLLLGGLVLLVLVAGTELFLRQGGLSGPARELIVARASGALHGEVKVERVRLSLFPPSVTATGVTLPPAGGAFAGGTVDEVRLSLSPWSLLTGGLKSLDLRARHPDLGFRVPRPAPGTPSGALPETLPDWAVYGAHRVRVTDGRVRVDSPAGEVTAEGLSVTGAPDVTLRRYDLELAAGAVALNGTPVLASATAEVTLEADRVRVRRAVFQGTAGRLEVSGEVRPPTPEEGEGPYLALRTGFAGEAGATADLAARLGTPRLALLGHVSAEGRLYGTPARLSWDGDLNGTGLGLADDPRRVESLEARLRVGEGTVELVHVKVGAGGGELRGVAQVALAAPHAYEGRVRADDVALAWLLGRDLPLGRLSGEARLKGDRAGPPLGLIQWRYRNPGAAGPLPEDAGRPLWERLGVRLAEGRGTARLEADGSQSHDLEAATPGSHLTARVRRDADGTLSGTGKLEADDFAEMGSLFGLDYVHGRVTADATLGGTLTAWRVEARARLAAGSVRDLKVDRLAGRVVLEPHRIAFDQVGAGGDGTLRLAGELWLPPPGEGVAGLGASLAADVRDVPLWQLVSLVHHPERLALDLPVSGKLHLVKGPGGLYTWARVRAGEGAIYEQPLAGAEAAMWVEPGRLDLTDVRLRLPAAAPSEPAPGPVVAGAAGGEAAGPEVTGRGTLRFEPAAYEVEAQTDGLPLDRVQVLATQVPYLSGTYAGGATLKGDFQDPDLRLSGDLREVGFHGLPVGQGTVKVSLSRWLLRLRGALRAPAGREGGARFTLVSHLRGSYPFAVSARATRADAVPWLRGLMPGFDALVRSQLGDDYGLSADGSVAAAGTFTGGPVYVLVKTSGARLTAGGREARAVGNGRLTLRDGTVSVTGMRLTAEGLDLEAGGTLRPDERFDLKVAGTVSAGWLALVRPEEGYTGGAAGVKLDVTGPWDAPRVRGTVTPRELVVAPPELAAAEAAFTLNGEIRVDGPLEAPAAGDVTARLAPFSVAVAGNALAAPRLDLTARAGVYRLPGVELAGEIGQVRVDGGWEYDRRVGLTAVGTLELATLVRQVPGLSQASGLAAVHGEVTGPWTAPRVRAGANMEGGRVRVDPLRQTLDLDMASVLYTDGKVVIDSLDGRLGGGPVSAEGSYDPATGEVRLAVTLDAYPFRAVPGLSGVVDGELLLAGTLPAPTLSGDLHVRQALYDRRMQWGAWLVDTVTSGRGEVARSNPMGDVRLALRVYGDEDIVVDNNLAKLVLDLDLAVGGTVQEPGLVGRLDVRQGEVYFRDHTFTVVSASVDFVQPGRIEPYLDVVARTTVDHSLPDDPLRTETIDVDLTLTGPPDRLDLNLTSRPDMPQADLLSLLAVGRTTEELAGAGTGVGASEATYLATGPLQSQIEEQVHRFTGLDQFQLEPFYAESSATSSSARLTVGKKLFDGKGLVVYSATLDAAQQPVIQLTYRLSTRTSVLLEQDEEGRAGGELRFRFRFR